MRALLITGLIATLLSPLSLAFAAVNLPQSTQELMYDADEFASVPADFRRMDLPTAQDLLRTQAQAQCSEDSHADIKWVYRTDRQMSYGNQIYLIKGVFTCVSNAPVCRDVGNGSYVICCDGRSCWIE
jgi:hypothetical protein